ncbi:glycosyltransferase family A protein [Algoriphagus namhaensis]|uniref:Glycosyltransferase family A protein n=1 Tax=Algoriphagus namhaensis TaxID=915353 RepID=A0ABV8AV85_9BACT
MRIGVNPAKLDATIPKKYYHRIIIPVFVPNFEGYFKEVFEVYKTCIKSAWLTQHGRSAITVVDNGSCIEVREWLHEQWEKGIIETLVSRSDNIGKVDAILGAARACREDLITISDSDILFKPGWQEATEEVFKCFEQAGSVAPFPIARHMYYFSSAVLRSIIQKKLSFGFLKSEFPKDIEDIYSCYEWDFLESYDGVLPTVNRNDHTAVVGSGHQIMTLRREAVFSLPNYPSFIKISNGSEVNWIDKPIDDLGYWRLSTLRPWVIHMGNTITDQNRRDFDQLKKNQNIPDQIALAELKKDPISNLAKRVYTRLFKKRFDKRGPAPKLKANIQQDGV